MSLFFKRKTSPEHPLVNTPASFRLRQGSTLTLVRDEPPCLTEAVLSGYTPDELLFTRVVGATSLPVLQPGETLRIQGMDEGFTQVTLKAKVKESTRVMLKVTDMEVEEHDQRRNRVRENIIRPAEKSGQISSIGEIVRSRPMADGLTEYGILFANLTKEKRRLFSTDIQEVLRRTRQGIGDPVPC